MSTMFIANNCTVESGSFMGDQLCALKTCYLFVESEPDVDRVIMSVSPGNQLHFLWEKFIDKYNIELIWDDWNPGDWSARWTAWDAWRTSRSIEGILFTKYREHYLRIHGAQRQRVLCGSERGLGRRNIYSYWFCGQEHCPDELPLSFDWFDDTLINHPPHVPTRDVYISPHCKTQGNFTFTFEFWGSVVRQLLDAGVTVTVGYDGYFCPELDSHPLYKKHWGDYQAWINEICSHKLVACGNTGTGWLSAVCGVPLFTAEPVGSQMPDHRYRECGLRNIVEVVDTPDAAYVARRITEEVRKCVVMTTGCYDVLHAGHVRHLERARALGTKLIVAMNSDWSVRNLKGTIDGSGNWLRPINPETQRKTVLEALRSVDEVKIVNDPMDLVREVRPDILAVGFGYTRDSIVGKEFVESYGGKCHVTCTGDARNEPSTTKIVRRVRTADVVELCRIGANASVNPFEKLKLMADQFLSVKELPGDVVDLGTCRGGTALILRRMATDKHLHLFDTWAGTPYDDPLCHHKAGEWVASLDECKKLVGKDEKTHYWDGVFPDTVFGLVEGNQYCFVYVDMDTERATCDALELFWPCMVPGGKIVVDDYAWHACVGVRKAVDEFVVANLEVCDANPMIVQNLFTCIIEKR